MASSSFQNTEQYELDSQILHYYLSGNFPFFFSYFIYLMCLDAKKTLNPNYMLRTESNLNTIFF